MNTEPRQLTESEIKDYSEAQQKWFPVIIQTYNTPLGGMMASPMKYAFLRTALILPVILLAIGVYLYLDSKGKMKINKLVVGAIALVVFIVLMVSGYLKQYRLNQDLLLVATLSPPNPTKYTYESSPVIQGKLMRNSIGRAGSSSGALGGGLVGGVIGSRLGRK